MAIRDAIIKCLDACYYISNNTKEFGDIRFKSSPKEMPYRLHPAITENNKITVYKNIHDFLAHNNEQIKKLFKDLHTKVLFGELFNKVEEELRNGIAEELV